MYLKSGFSNGECNLCTDGRFADTSLAGHYQDDMFNVVQHCAKIN